MNRRSILVNLSYIAKLNSDSIPTKLFFFVTLIVIDSFKDLGNYGMASIIFYATEGQVDKCMKEIIKLNKTCSLIFNVLLI